MPISNRAKRSTPSSTSTSIRASTRTIRRAFLKAWHRAGLLEFAGFRGDAGALRAVVGMFGQGSLLSAPIVGYDTGWPASAVLYRLLMAHVLSTTSERDAVLNLSAGAAHFKRLMGSELEIQCSARAKAPSFRCNAPHASRAVYVDDQARCTHHETLCGDASL